MTDHDTGSNVYRRAQEKYDGLRTDTSLYFENNKDLVAASEFESAMALGCFDREFMYFAIAYQDGHSVAYRISAREMNLHRFVEMAAAQGLYPTPVRRFIRRLPCPSGHELRLGRQVKVEAAKALRTTYNAAYFQALDALAATAPNDSAYPLLKGWQEELEGVYDCDRLMLYRGLVQTALNSKVLTLQSYLSLEKWLGDMAKQLEDDIVAKGLYKKVLSVFAYRQDGQGWQLFNDAKTEVAYEKKAIKECQGYQTTPIFMREGWLTDMSRFRQMRQQFLADYQHYCDEGYLDRLVAVKSLPGVIRTSAFDKQLAKVRQHCSEEAVRVFSSYRYRWNVQ